MALLEQERSANGPGMHVAFYEFASGRGGQEAIQEIGMAVKPLIEDFDRPWQGRVTRRRAVLDVVQEHRGSARTIREERHPWQNWSPGFAGRDTRARLPQAVTIGHPPCTVSGSMLES